MTDSDSQSLRSGDNGDTHHHHHYHFHYHFANGDEDVRHNQTLYPPPILSSPAPRPGPDHEKVLPFPSFPTWPGGQGSSSRAYPHPSFPHPPPYIPARNYHGRPLPLGEDVRVFCEAGTGYSLTVRNGSVVLASADPSDEFQHWIKDVKHSTKVKDSEGFECFALVNKVTGLALQCAVGKTQPVRLTVYRRGAFDESILWSMGRKLEHGYRAIRMVKKIKLNLDAFQGNKKYNGGRGVFDGTHIVLWDWNEGDNQKWKLVPY